MNIIYFYRYGLFLYIFHVENEIDNDQKYERQTKNDNKNENHTFVMVFNWNWRGAKIIIIIKRVGFSKKMKWNNVQNFQGKSEPNKSANDANSSIFHSNPTTLKQIRFV